MRNIKRKIELRNQYNKRIMERQKEEVKRQESLEIQKKEKEKTNNLDKGREEIKRYINGLLIEYKAAKEYFNKNGLKTQEDDANNKVIQLDNDLKHFEQGFTVYYDTLPKPITPEYIYNCSTDKRNSIFKDGFIGCMEKLEFVVLLFSLILLLTKFLLL